MVHVSIAMNTAALSGMSGKTRARRSRNDEQRSTSSDEKKIVKTKHAILKEKFEQAWNAQEERLSKFEVERSKFLSYDTATEYGWSTGEGYYVYPNGETARFEKWNDPERLSKRFDELGNCIEYTYQEPTHETKDSTKTTFTKTVYYEGTNQKAFESSLKGIRHFDRNGRDDTRAYVARQLIAAKRIREEIKTGEILPKMGKMEKAVATIFKNTKEMTFIEKALAKKNKDNSKR